MDRFYSIVLLVAVITLIIILTYIGMLMNYQQANQTTAFPPRASTCPDYWELAEDHEQTCQIPQQEYSNEYDCQAYVDRYPDIHDEIGGNDCTDTNVADNAKEHWKFKGSPEGRIPGKLIKHPNVGNIYNDNNKIQLNSSNTPGYNFVDFSIDFNNKGWMMKGTEMCSKKKWANSNGIIWDGVSNYNDC